MGLSIGAKLTLAFFLILLFDLILRVLSAEVHPWSTIESPQF